jgi:isopentenyl diphosphate isomerase/L-lactate dehydrogenase-like FMN-dependent dehydrogenase
VWVSNHGGRQLDHTQGSIDALPPIVDTVAGRAAIVVDGGFTRGTAVLKGLALGAAVIAVERTVLWGLAPHGAAGVACALDILRQELRTTMALAGQTNVKTLERNLVFRVDWRGAYAAAPTNPSTAIRRFATGSTAKKRLSSATAPRAWDHRGR